MVIWMPKSQKVQNPKVQKRRWREMGEGTQNERQRARLQMDQKKAITMVQSKNLGRCWRKEVRGKREDEKVGSEKEGKGREGGKEGAKSVLEEVHERAGVNHQTTTKRVRSSIGIHWECF